MTEHPTPNMSQPTSSTFKVGDRVRSVSEDFHGQIGTVVKYDAADPLSYSVRFGVKKTYSFAEKELEPEMRQASPQALIALAEALGAVEHNSWTADGLLCRRYITADGSIDLTVRVP